MKGFVAGDGSDEGRVAEGLIGGQGGDQPRGAYRRIAVRATVTAPYPVLAGLLRSIEEASPRLLADDLQVIGNRGVVRDAALPLQASLVVMGFRAGP